MDYLHVQETSQLLTQNPDEPSIALNTNYFSSALGKQPRQISYSSTYLQHNILAREARVIRHLFQDGWVYHMVLASQLAQLYTIP
jgi:hypothetical protein